MFCRYCGTKFQGNFCPKCGSRVLLAGETRTSAASHEGFNTIKHRRLVTIWFWCSAVILLGAAMLANNVGNYVFGIFLLLCSLLSVPLWLSARRYQLENRRPPKWARRLIVLGFLVFFLAWLWLVLLLVCVIISVIRSIWYYLQAII